jgi:hypothetical protein
MPVTPDPCTSGLEQVLRDNTDAVSEVLDVVKDVLASHGQLLEIIDGLSYELSVVSDELAAVRVATGTASEAPAMGSRVAQASLREAATLAQRAAAILERSDVADPEEADRRALSH